MIETINEEKQRRGQAFLVARAQLCSQYNCTITVVPIWVQGVNNTFVTAFDEQVMVGDAPEVEIEE